MEKRVFQWQKLGQVFEPSLQQGRSWMQEFAQSPSALVYEDFVRVYFCTRPQPDSEGRVVSRMASLDLDRHDLLRVIHISPEPVLNLGGSGAFDEFGTYPVSVIRDGLGKVRVYYAGVSRCVSVPFNAAIGVAISSDDGATFERIGKGPVLSYSPDEPFILGSPRIRRFAGRWQLWYASGKVWLPSEGRLDPVYKIRMASSPDGYTWVKQGRDLLTDRLGQDECQACPDVLWRDGLYHMFFSYRHCHHYQSGPGGYRIGYACSTDMENWQRVDELAGMSVSPSGWDAEMVNYPHVFELDGHTYMLYQGNGMGRSGFGLAKLISPDYWGQT